MNIGIKQQKPRKSRLLYSERESNPHSVYGNRILSPACLPVPPSEQVCSKSLCLFTLGWCVALKAGIEHVLRFTGTPIEIGACLPVPPSEQVVRSAPAIRLAFVLRAGIEPALRFTGIPIEIGTGLPVSPSEQVSKSLVKLHKPFNNKSLLVKGI
ncbi:MAG: hypothetical protein JWR50_1210 [Mucilaginibacter sp.]|nr:hypothetical protein [Mucilaginibacter sp.]